MQFPPNFSYFKSIIWFKITAFLTYSQAFFPRVALDLRLNHPLGGSSMLKSLFTTHPASVDESYPEHMAVALSFSARLLFAGIVCLVHAFLPFLFVRTGSQVIAELHDRMVLNRHRASSIAPGQDIRDITTVG
jgi:hypothetical protein